MRLLYAGHADGGAGSAEAGAVRRPASRSANICPAITAAAPAIRPSSMRSRPRRGPRMRARAMTAPANPRSFGAGPAEFLYRQDGAAAQPRSADAGARALCQRRRTAAHGACGVPALAACACQNRRDRCDRREAHPGRHRGRDRQGTGRCHHAMGRRALAYEGSQIGAAARDRDRSCLLAGRGGRRHRGDQPRGRRGRRRTRRGRIPRNWRR